MTRCVVFASELRRGSGSRHPWAFFQATLRVCTPSLHESAAANSRKEAKRGIIFEGQQPKIFDAASKAQRALVGTIEASVKAVEAAEKELDSPAQLPPLGTVHQLLLAL